MNLNTLSSMKGHDYRVALCKVSRLKSLSSATSIRSIKEETAFRCVFRNPTCQSNKKVEVFVVLSLESV